MCTTKTARGRVEVALLFHNAARVHTHTRTRTRCRIKCDLREKTTRCITGYLNLISEQLITSVYTTCGDLWIFYFFFFVSAGRVSAGIRTPGEV